MRLVRTVLRLAVAAALAAPIVGAACGDGGSIAPSVSAAAAGAYVGRWIVADPQVGPIPLGLHLTRGERGLAARVTYSGVAYDATGTVGRGGFDLRQVGGHARLTGALRRDGLLDVVLDTTDPAASSAPLRLVLRRED